MDNPRLYDLLGHLFFLGRRRSVFRRLAALSGATPGDRVLDAGCGTGYFTRILAETVGLEGSALGIDPSTEPLERARRLTHLSNCSFREGAAEALDAGDATFDLVVSSLMIHHLPDELRARAISEIFRVLRPGGRILVADLRPPTNPLARQLIRRVVSPAMEHNPLHLLEPMIRAAGFDQISTGEVRPWIHYVIGTKPDEIASP